MQNSGSSWTLSKPHYMSCIFYCTQFKTVKYQVTYYAIGVFHELYKQCNKHWCCFWMRHSSIDTGNSVGNTELDFALFTLETQSQYEQKGLVWVFFQNKNQNQTKQTTPPKETKTEPKPALFCFPSSGTLLSSNPRFQPDNIEAAD